MKLFGNKNMIPDLDYKKILLAFLLVLVSASLLFGIIWFVFLRGQDGPVEGPVDTTVDVGGLPAITTGGQANIIGEGGRLITSDDIQSFFDDLGNDTGYSFTDPDTLARGSYTKVAKLIDEEIQDVSAVQNGFVYLNSGDNKFYRIDLNGNQSLLSDKEFPFVDQVEWSADGNKVVLEYPDGANIVHDFIKNKTTTLPKGLEDPNFDNSSENIAYKFIGGEDDNWLVISNINNNTAEVIESLGDNKDKVQVVWSPANTVVALYHKPIGLNKEEVYFVGLQGENFKSMVVDGFNFEGLWNNKGTRLLYHVIDGDNNYLPTLWIVDAMGDNIGNNNFNLGFNTWVDKCTFAQNDKVVYCAVPMTLPEASGLYRDYLNESPDVFYKIDLTTGVGELIALPVLSEDNQQINSFQVGKLMLTNNDSQIVFLDNFTNGIYSLKLR